MTDLHLLVINKISTRLNTTDLDMWRAAGLCLDSAGYIVPSNRPSDLVQMADDMVCNALVWLVMKLVNFIAAGDDLPPEISRLGFDVRQRPLVEYWEDLERQLDVWYSGLPDGFSPSSTVWPEDDKAGANIPKKSFIRPMYASTMQWYHFARIELLHNKPHIFSSVEGQASKHKPASAIAADSPADHHRSHATILQQSKYHAKEIISIGFALTDEGARVHSVQPLYAAGQVLGAQVDVSESSAKEHSALRAYVIGLLRDIERDTGWATQYRATQLLDQWRLPEGTSESMF